MRRRVRHETGTSPSPDRPLSTRGQRHRWRLPAGSFPIHTPLSIARSAVGTKRRVWYPVRGEGFTTRAADYPAADAERDSSAIRQLHLDHAWNWGHQGPSTYRRLATVRLRLSSPSASSGVRCGCLIPLLLPPCRILPPSTSLHIRL